MTYISDATIAAFKGTDYRVFLSGAPFVLKIDVESPELASLMRTKSVDAAAFITAFNPASSKRSMAENLRDHQALKQDLLARLIEPVEGEGAHPNGSWDAETSWLAPGLSLEEASEIGRAYGQDAILWSGPDAVPRLILLR